MNNFEATILISPDITKDNLNKVVEMIEKLVHNYCSLLDENDKDVYMNQFLIEIASYIDEESQTYYDNFNYSKQFKPSNVQLGLQTPNNLTSLLYLSDLYGVSSIIYIDSLQVKITTSKSLSYS